MNIDVSIADKKFFFYENKSLIFFLKIPPVSFSVNVREMNEYDGGEEKRG